MADVIDDPRTPTVVDPISRVTLTNPGLYPGCVALNLFGEGVSSAAARAGMATLNQDQRQL